MVHPGKVPAVTWNTKLKRANNQNLTPKPRVLGVAPQVKHLIEGVEQLNKCRGLRNVFHTEVPEWVA
tara:strand:+ start:437 stop:637 length:201 start_codon:yes stop_codon:yes gene_type:complete